MHKGESRQIEYVWKRKQRTLSQGLCKRRYRERSLGPRERREAVPPSPSPLSAPSAPAPRRVLPLPGQSKFFSIFFTVVLFLLLLEVLLVLFLFFGRFRATPAAYGNAQARDRIGAGAAGYTTATATPDLSCVCDLHHGSRQCRILNPLRETGD